MKKDLTGQKFGLLTVTNVHSRSRNGHVRWSCICECGNEHLCLSTHLLSGRTVSCGCKRRQGGTKSKQWSGCGDISGNVWSDIKSKTKKSKSREKLTFDITIEYAWDLFLKQDKKCALSGVDIVFHHDDGIKVRNTKTASLDRIDSSMGYIEGNVQWVHKDINLMKNRFDQSLFLEWCNKIAQHNGGKS